MYKIGKVDFLNHPILGNLSLNFCDANGHAVDTVIIDIQALDDADVSYWVKTHPHTSTDNIDVHERMPRFTRAFDRIK